MKNSLLPILGAATTKNDFAATGNTIASFKNPATRENLSFLKPKNGALFSNNSYTLNTAAPANSYKRKPAAFSFRLLMILVLCLGAGKGWGQTTTQNFGTGTGSNTTQTASTSLIPNPSSGTTYARAGASAPNAPVVLANISNPLGTTDSYIRAVSSSSTSVTKVSPIVGYTSGLEFYTSFKVLFGDASAGSTATTGSWTFAQGVGAFFSDNNSYATAQTFVALRFSYGASGALTLTYDNGSFVSTSLTTSAFNQATIYTIEIIGNNKTSGTISYTYNGVSQTVAIQKFDLFINGTRVGDDLTKAGLASNTSINATTFTAISSTSNVANLFVDDVVIYNAVPATIGSSSTNFYSKSTGNLDDVANWGTNTDGTGTAPANFTTANQVFNIRNNATPTIGAAWTVSGSGSKIIVGDGTNACNFTIPSSFAVTGTVDVSANGTLTNQNTTSPTFGTLTGTVVYDGSSAQTILTGTYGNLTIQNSAATKTFGGNITLNSSSTLTLASGVTLDANTRTITFGTTGNATINGTLQTSNTNGFSGSSSTTIVSTNSPTITLGSSSTIIYNSGSAQTVTSRTYANIQISNTGATKTPGGNITLGNSNTFTLDAGVTYNAGTTTITFGTSGSATINGIFQTANTTAGGFSGASNSSIISTNTPTITLGTGSTVEYNSTSTQTVTTANTYYNLLISGTTGVKSINANTSIAAGGTFTVNASSTINMSTTSMSFGAGCFVAINGTLQTQAGSGFSGSVYTAIDVTNSPTITLGSSSTIEYNKSSSTQTITARDYRNLIISGNSTMSLGGNVTVQGGSTMTVSSNLACGNSTIAQSGSGTATITVTGTISTTNTDGLNGSATTTINSSNTILTLGSSSTVDYASASAQTITAATYASITNTGGGARTLGGTITISGTLTTGAGYYTVGTSTVNFNGTSAQTIPVIPVASGGNYYNLTYSGSSTGTMGGSMTVAGNVTTSLGSLNITTTTSKTLTVNGNLIISGGTIDFGGTGATVSGNISLNGNLSQTSGGITTTANIANGLITFSGSGTTLAPQTLTLTLISALNYTNLTINSGTVVQLLSNILLRRETAANAIYQGTIIVAGTLDCGTFTYNGGINTTTTSTQANFTINSGGTLITSNTAGINTSIGTTNLVRTFSAGANYTFNAATITAFPTAVQQVTFGSPANITVNTNITLNRNITATGTVDLTDKVVTNTGNTLTLSGAISRTTGTIAGTGTTEFVGPSSIPSGLFASNTVAGSLIINRGGGVSLSSDLTVSGTLTFTSGNLTIGSNTLTLSGAVVNTSGTLTGSATSNLTIGGTAGTLNFTSGSRTLKDLTLGTSAIATLGTALDITAGSASGTVTVGTSATLTTGGFLTLKSDANGTARVAPVLGTITGNATVERYIPAKRAWRALTAPLKGSNTSIFSQWQNNGTVTSGVGLELWGPAGDATPSSANTGMAVGPNSSMLQYVSGAWTTVTNTNTTNLFSSTANNAFMVFPTGGYGSGNIASGTTAVATTLKATGQLITGDVPYTNLPSSSHTLIGNPYASPLSLTAMFVDNIGFGGNIWIWDANVAGTNAVGTFNLFSAVANSYTNLTSNIQITSGTQIQSGQAFFVIPTANLSTFTIKETHKGTAFSNAVLRTAAPELLRVGLYKQVNTEWSGRDGAMAVILADADANQVPNKMANGTENVAFTKNAGLFASYQHLPLVAADVLNVKVWNTTAGANYKLKINTEQFTSSLSATLEDAFTNSRTPLTLDGSAVEYPFAVTTDALSTGNRFRIVFQTAALGINNPKANGFSIIPNPVTGDAFQVNLGTLAMGTYSYSICNAIGQEVEKGSINNVAQNTSYSVKFRETAATGIYIMKIKGTDNSVFTAKLIKK